MSIIETLNGVAGNLGPHIITCYRRAFNLEDQKPPHEVHLKCGQELKDISTLVRKHWRCGYVECSAKYNYKIGDVFRELMGCTAPGCLPSTEFSPSVRNKGRCNIL